MSTICISEFLFHAYLFCCCCFDVIIGSCPVRQPIVTCHIDAILGNFECVRTTRSRIRFGNIFYFYFSSFSFALSLDMRVTTVLIKILPKTYQLFFGYFWPFDDSVLSNHLLRLMFECLESI